MAMDNKAFIRRVNSEKRKIRTFPSHKRLLKYLSRDKLNNKLVPQTDIDRFKTKF